jgi:hypothetical protein
MLVQLFKSRHQEFEVLEPLKIFLFDLCLLGSAHDDYSVHHKSKKRK